MTYFNRYLNSVFILVIALQLFSCRENKNLNESCLILIPGKYHNDVDFNPKWLSEKKIKRIIERSYFEGDRENVVYSNVLEINSAGYLTKLYHKVDSAELYSSNIRNFESSYDYKVYKKDSYSILERPIFPTENNSVELPDSIIKSRKLFAYAQIFNFESSPIIKDQKNEIIRKYSYDKKGILKEIIDNKNNIVLKLKHISSNKIQIEKYYPLGDVLYHLITQDNKGLIIENYREEANATSYFTYNENGAMIEEKIFFQDRPPNYFTYEFIINEGSSF